MLVRSSCAFIKFSSAWFPFGDGTTVKPISFAFALERLRERMI